MIPDKAIELVKHFEGCRLTRYKDVAGYDTIGFGHLITPGDGVGETIPQEQADDLLKIDLQRTLHGIFRYTAVVLNDNQLSALISFVFNLGIGAYQRSQLRMAVNRKDFNSACDKFLMYDRAAGKINHGLYLRRVAEAKLFGQ